jgi:hypothetical protein
VSPRHGSLDEIEQLFDTGGEEGVMRSSAGQQTERRAADARAEGRLAAGPGGQPLAVVPHRHEQAGPREPALAARPASEVLTLLNRSDAELVAADLAGSPEERFVHGHLAALRAGAAVVAAVGRTGRRRAPRPVWELVAQAAPELAGWSARFAAAAPLRAAVETGRRDVPAGRADRAVAEATAFSVAVRDLLGADGLTGLRAS